MSEWAVFFTAGALLFLGLAISLIRQRRSESVGTLSRVVSAAFLLAAVLWTLWLLAILIIGPVGDPYG